MSDTPTQSQGVLSTMKDLREALDRIQYEVAEQLSKGAVDPDLLNAEQSARDALRYLAHVGRP